MKRFALLLALLLPLVAIAPSIMVQGQGAAQPAPVTSVGLSLPNFITVSGSPVRKTGTLTGTLANQSANTVFAGQTSGTGVPTFRLLVAGDIPALPEGGVTNLTSDLAAKVPATRNIATTAPLAGGRDLSADVPLTIAKSDATHDGYLAQADWSAFNQKMPVRSVKNYGAVGDGSTDDTTAINATFTAAAAAGGGAVYLPGSANNYIISAAIPLPANCTFFGDGYASCLQIINAKNAAMKMITATSVSNVAIRNIRLNGNNTNNSSGQQEGINFQAVSYGMVENCWVEHLGRTATASCEAIFGGACVSCQFKGNTITDTVVGIQFGGTDLTITGNKVISINRDYPFNISSCNDSIISHNSAFNGGGGSTRACMRFTNSSRNTVVGNRCDGASAAPVDGILVESSSADNLFVGNLVRNINAGSMGIWIKSTAGTNNQFVGNNARATGGIDFYPQKPVFDFGNLFATMTNDGSTVVTVTPVPTALAISNVGSTRLLGVLRAADMTLTTDQAIPMSSGLYTIDYVVVTNASVTPIAAAGGIYSAASKGGTAIVAAGQTYTTLTSAVKMVQPTLDSSTTTQTWSGANLYLNLTTGNSAALTVDIYVYGRDLNG